jgi:hypothetical protein
VTSMCSYRVDGHRVLAVVAGLALFALVAAPAAAQETQENKLFKSVNFGVPIVPAAEADPQAPAAPPPDPDAGFLGFFRGTELGGLVDAYYAYYSTKQPALFHSFDTAHNQFTLSMAQIWLNKAPTTDSRIGGKVKLIFGPSATAINFNEPNKDLANIEEGFVSYMAPTKKGLQFDVGKFVTAAGAEVIEAKDDLNYSRSLLFQNAIPFYHVGVRMTYTESDKVTWMFGVVNGWNNAADNNTGKTILASLTAKPTAAWTFVENYVGGPEQPLDNKDWRNLSDTILTYAKGPQTATINYDYGRETLAVTGTKVHWQGVALYYKYQANKVVAVIPRYEYYSDPQGYTTFGGYASVATPQKLQEFTFTVELKAADNFMWRIEYRGDFSNVATAFKTNTGTFKKSQNGIVFGLLYNFSTKS